MTFRLALRSLTARPVRSAVLAAGFGLGVGVMAGLLGVGEVILEQARSPDLQGGGDAVVEGWTGSVDHARVVLSSMLTSGELAERVTAASPSTTTTLYLFRDDGTEIAVTATGGIPSLERALDNPETAGLPGWEDAPGDVAWTSPDPGELLRIMDRFHPIPDVPRWRDSWAEWLYFNGSAGGARFYLTFLVGPETEDGKRLAGVRLQLEQDGRMASWADSAKVPAFEVLESAPDLTIANCSVRLDRLSYRLKLDFGADALRLPESGETLSGELVLEATPGRSFPPFTLRGAGGWRSGYTVPVLSGPIHGELNVGERQVRFDDGSGYHDHNWGFWEGVSWRWGQVAHDDVSFLYGRVFPPTEAADPHGFPGFLGAVGPDGPLGFSRRVTIEETDDPATGFPARILVRGKSESIDLRMELDVEDGVRNLWDRDPGSASAGGLDLIQMRARYQVSGSVGDRAVEFEATGSAETFRGR